MLISALLYAAGCDPEPRTPVSVQGRIYLPTDGEPTVSPDEVCNLVSVAVYYRTVQTASNEHPNYPFAIDSIQHKTTFIQDPVGGSYDASSRSCSYSVPLIAVALAQMSSTWTYLSASYKMSHQPDPNSEPLTTWSPVGQTPMSIYGSVQPTIEGQSIKPSDVHLSAVYRPR